MTLDAAIAYFREQQQDLFRDTATVKRPEPGGVLDPVTGIFTPNPPMLIYDGACLLRGLNWEGTDTQAGTLDVRIRGMQAKFPPDTDVRKDDIVVPTSSVYDSALIDRSFHVTDVRRDGWQIVRWVICEEVT